MRILERYVFVRDGTSSGWLRFGHALVEVVASARRGAARTARVSATATFAAPAKQNQIAADHFGHVFFLAAGLVIPGAGLEAAFDVDLATLFQIFAGDLGQPLP